ncbi:hypothetical protein GUJ93_ZPchr0009g203 [Zizania palustris]|uniref:Uncharacterized protein n=1 Tax=Zizania palustris TaxID=103762 RepID=A0A8J5S749_ZIZPA|nr:hypothetical protein GUJ93_ZPchr0009g203 [Zizania palustris]
MTASRPHGTELSGIAVGKGEEATGVVKVKTPPAAEPGVDPEASAPDPAAAALDQGAAVLYLATTETSGPPCRRGEIGERRRGEEESGTGDRGGSPAMVVAAVGEGREEILVL